MVAGPFASSTNCKQSELKVANIANVRPTAMRVRGWSDRRFLLEGLRGLIERRHRRNAGANTEMNMIATKIEIGRSRLGSSEGSKTPATVKFISSASSYKLMQLISPSLMFTWADHKFMVWKKIPQKIMSGAKIASVESAWLSPSTISGSCSTLAQSSQCFGWIARESYSYVTTDRLMSRTNQSTGLWAHSVGDRRVRNTKATGDNITVGNIVSKFPPVNYERY